MKETLGSELLFHPDSKHSLQKKRVKVEFNDKVCSPVSVLLHLLITYLRF